MIHARTQEVWVSSTDGKIRSFYPDFKFKMEFGDEGPDLAQFRDPMGFDFDGDKRIIIADCGNSRLQYFDFSGNFLGTFGSKGPGVGGFSLPRDLKISQFNGDLVVADTGNGRIQVFDITSTFSLKFQTESSGSTYLPTGVSVNSFGDIIVVGQGRPLVQIYSSEGLFLKSWNLDGMNIQFTTAQFVFIDGADKIGIVDWLTASIIVFDKAGNLLFQVGGYLCGPRGITVHQNGDILITNHDKHQGTVKIATPK